MNAQRRHCPSVARQRRSPPTTTAAGAATTTIDESESESARTLAPLRRWLWCALKGIVELLATHVNRVSASLTEDHVVTPAARSDALAREALATALTSDPLQYTIATLLEQCALAGGDLSQRVAPRAFYDVAAVEAALRPLWTTATDALAATSSSGSGAGSGGSSARDMDENRPAAAQAFRSAKCATATRDLLRLALSKRDAGVGTVGVQAAVSGFTLERLCDAGLSPAVGSDRYRDLLAASLHQRDVLAVQLATSKTFAGWIVKQNAVTRAQVATASFPAIECLRRAQLLFGCLSMLNSTSCGVCGAGTWRMPYHTATEPHGVAGGPAVAAPPPTTTSAASPPGVCLSAAPACRDVFLQKMLAAGVVNALMMWLNDPLDHAVAGEDPTTRQVLSLSSPPRTAVPTTAGGGRSNGGAASPLRNSGRNRNGGGVPSAGAVNASLADGCWPWGSPFFSTRAGVSWMLTGQLPPSNTIDETTELRLTTLPLARVNRSRTVTNVIFGVHRTLLAVDVLAAMLPPATPHASPGAGNPAAAAPSWLDEANAAHVVDALVNLAEEGAEQQQVSHHRRNDHHRERDDPRGVRTAWACLALLRSAAHGAAQLLSDALRCSWSSTTSRMIVSRVDAVLDRLILPDSLLIRFMPVIVAAVDCLLQHEAKYVPTQASVPSSRNDGPGGGQEDDDDALNVVCRWLELLSERCDHLSSSLHLDAASRSSLSTVFSLRRLRSDGAIILALLSSLPAMLFPATTRLQPPHWGGGNEQEPQDRFVSGCCWVSTSLDAPCMTAAPSLAAGVVALARAVGKLSNTICTALGGGKSAHRGRGSVLSAAAAQARHRYSTVEATLNRVALPVAVGPTPVGSSARRRRRSSPSGSGGRRRQRSPSDGEVGARDDAPLRRQPEDSASPDATLEELLRRDAARQQQPGLWRSNADADKLLSPPTTSDWVTPVARSRAT